jgi:hypothetical protein
MLQLFSFAMSDNVNAVVHKKKFDNERFGIGNKCSLIELNQREQPKWRGCRLRSNQRRTSATTHFLSKYLPIHSNNDKNGCIFSSIC